MLGPELLQQAIAQNTEQQYKQAAAAGIETPEQRFEREATMTILGQQPRAPQVRQVEIAEGPDGKVTPGISHIYMRSEDGSMIHIGTKREAPSGGKGEGKSAVTSADANTIDSYLYREYEPQIRAAIASKPNADVQAELASLTDPLTGTINVNRVFQFLTPEQRKEWATASADYARRIQQTGNAQELFSERLQKRFNEQPIQLTTDQRAQAQQAVEQWNRDNPKKRITLTPENEVAIWQKLQQIQAR